MSVYIIAFITFIVGFVIAFLLAKNQNNKLTSDLTSKINVLDNQNNTNNNLINELKELNYQFSKEKEQIQLDLIKKIAQLESAESKLEDQKKEVNELQSKLQKDFEILATKILDEKSSKFTEKNKENINQILKPLQEKIHSFEKKVEDTHKESLEKQSALRQQILGLEKLNQKMSQDAINLTKALKGESKKQGDWGELQLEMILEKAGLTKDIHYSTQGGFRDDQGLLKKPDFIINLPDNKHLIIDSKVSLTAYERFFNADNELDEAEGLKKHLLSLKKHMKDLSSKKYSDLYGINSPDYVMLFVPIEPALMVALQHDGNLYLEALDKNIVLVSASTLLATLTTVASIWKQEDQKRNVLEIAKQAGALYDKFNGLAEDLLKIGKQINASQEGYKAAMNKLTEGKGNLVNRVEKLKKLGAKTQKSLPENLLHRANND